MSAMSAEEFEQRYQRDADPWRYRCSPYERSKYAATLAACGPGPFRSALELGGSIGLFSALLAPRCRSLTTIDFAPSAVAVAEAELAEHPQARAVCGRIPDDLPEGPFDLIVASEVLYYLDREALAATLAALEQRLLSGGRLVGVHWRQPGPERPLSAERVHRSLRAARWLVELPSPESSDYLLDVLERR
jgi:predicted O-methyltransferase YrrM